MQRTDLRRIFHFVIDKIAEIIKIEEKLGSELHNLLLKLVSIAENILFWSFSYCRLDLSKKITITKPTDIALLRPVHQWKETYLDSSVIQLFFKVC